MRNVMLAAVAVVLSCAAASAQEKPKVVPLPAVQPLQPRVVPVTAARMAALEEEVETLEANRDVKKAYVRAAEVALKANEKTYALVKAATGTASATELNKAEADFEMSKAQLDIRVAELKEVEVKIKHAKKRLEDAKAAGVRPAPGVQPKAQNLASIDAAKLAKWKAMLERAMVNAEREKAEAQRVTEELKKCSDKANAALEKAIAELEAQRKKSQK